MKNKTLYIMLFAILAVGITISLLVTKTPETTILAPGATPSATQIA